MSMKKRRRMVRGQSFLKRFLVPSSLFGRSLLILIVPVLLIQLITTAVFFDRHWGRMTSRLAFAVAGEITVMAEAIEQDPTPERVERITGYAARGLELLISYAPGAVLPEYERRKSPGLWEKIVAQTLEEELERHLRRPFQIHADFREKWVEVDVQLPDGVMNVSLPERRLFSSSGYIFLLWMFAISTLLLGVAILFMRNQIRPIRRLAIAAEFFGKGRDVAKFKPEGAREVRQAAEAFLDMRERIKRQIEQRTIMLAGVSHDLRTPLTRLKLQLAMMGDAPDVKEMQQDIQDMEKMIAGYLDFVSGDAEEEFVRMPLSDLIEKVAQGARQQGRQVHMELEEITLAVRPMAFERCLANLVGNAAQYASDIWIEAGRDGDQIVLTVQDNGPGIPEDRYEEVFKPFTRIDPSRNPETGGVGLGLPIAMDMVHSHGGKIWLEPSEHGGLCVVITLPV